MAHPKNIVVMGGGTGSFTVLSGLRDSGHHITAIVTMADHGGSSGVLRDELGVLPPGDIRQCLVALSKAQEPLRELFTHRFAHGSLRGHTTGNLFLAALEELTGSFEKAVETASEVLHIHGRVLPVTLKNVELCARLKNGVVLAGEPAVTQSKDLRTAGLKRLYLKPQAHANPKAVEAILAADLFVLAPGDLYSSLIPNLLVRGIPQAIFRSKARKVYVCNLITKRGHTDGFFAHDFLEAIEQWAFAGERPADNHTHLFDTVFYNTQPPPKEVLKRYEKQEGALVPFDRTQSKRLRNVRFIGAPLLSENVFVPKEGDALASQRSFIRHDPDKLGRTLLDLLTLKRFLLR